MRGAASEASNPSFPVRPIGRGYPRAASHPTTDRLGQDPVPPVRPRPGAKVRRWLWLLLAGSLAAPALRAATQVVWNETFETDDYGDRWHVEGGVWGVGKPTSGPNQAHPPSLRCAGTVLAGNYPSSADARFVRDEPFIVQAAELCPRLRFWHWNSNYPEDPCTVEVRVTGGVWQRISPTYVYNSQAWTRATLDLRDFAGQSIIIAFRLKSNSDAKVAAGWYVDDVEYVTGCPDYTLVNRPEGFEQGLGDWSVEGGEWDAGVPATSLGPGKAYAGTRCAGTILEGNYDAYADARLISPEFILPVASDYPRLRFWHWNHNYPQDPCTVEIRGADGTWTTLSTNTSPYSRVWTRTTLDLRAYADQRVQLAFHLLANGDNNVGGGWYVDNVEVVTGLPELRLLESFESDYGDWSVEGGDWQVGRPPTNLGPGKAYAGSNCAATVLDGNYDANLDSRLISPEFEVPAATEYPRLRFWHWYNTYLEDPAWVEIRPVGGAWQTIGGAYTWASLVWTRPTLDLRAFAGQTVQVAFHFRANSDNNVSSGWYVDEVEVARGKPVFDIINNPEQFSGGIGEWSAEKGDWQVGVPKAGPGKAYSFSSCAGTVLDGNYDARINTRLISPEFAVPPATDFPRLRFWQWYSTYQGDLGSVEIRTASGIWEPLSAGLCQLNNRAWTRTALDLTRYAGQSVQLGFRFQANTDANVAAGWYVDDIEVATGRSCFSLVNNPEGFEGGLGDWNVVPGNWQVGKPTNGPPAAFKGVRCAGTVLDGNYDPSLYTRLISPEFVVPCAESAPRLRFAHWHAFGTGDTGLVEIRELPDSPWYTLGETYGGSSGGWVTGYAELAEHAGKWVQLAFRLQANSDSSVGTGWYVDEVRIQASLGNAPPDQQILEGGLLSFPVTPACRNLKLRLSPDAPAGAFLDPELGLFTWRPEECDGPGIHEVKYLLFDPAHDECPLGTLTNHLEVLEQNEAPVFRPVPPLPIQPGVFVEFRVADYVYDPDCPAQRLTYTLEPGSPTNAALAKTSGQLLWIPNLEQCGRTNTVVIRVTDDGQPPLSATQTILAYPQVRFRAPRPVTGELELIVEGASPGLRYQVLASSNLAVAPAEWTRLDSGLVPAGGLITVRRPLGTEPTMFYQCLVLQP